jgi:nucleotide-binding universal stress UspA family protein
MRNKKNRRLNVNGSRAATHLYVTDLVNDSEEILDFTCELAERNGARLQVLHIVDPEHTPSMPDAQMGIQYRLEALARRLKHLTRTAQAVLLFGNPERVIPKIAAAAKATLVIIPFNGSAIDRARRRLFKRLTRKCDCTVLAFPSNIATRRRPASSPIRSGSGANSVSAVMGD